MKSLNRVKRKSNESIKNDFFVFDTETTKLEPKPENFVFGVIYGFNFTKVIYSVEDFKKEFSKIKYKGKTIFAHNAEFDLLTIFGNIITNIDESAIFNGKFIMCKYKYLTFADSLNILPASVENIGKVLNLEKIENEKVKTQGLRKNNISEKDIEYCIRDCKIIYDTLLFFFLDVGQIKLTVASLSLYSFRKNYLTKNIEYNEFNNDFFNSYYGGRTEVFKLGKTESKVYDINSLYPYVMENMTFPDFKKVKKIINPDLRLTNYLIKNSEGFADIEVYHKDSYFGFLPMKLELNKSEKLCFPVGTFRTQINFNELRFAIKNDMIEILSCYYIVYSEPIETIFKDFINYLYGIKSNAKSELEIYIAKLKMNSLYGRFAMKEKYKETYYDNIPFELIEELENSNKFFRLSTFSKERNDCFLKTENVIQKNSFFAIPSISSYITSQARIKILTGLLENEKNNVTYTDTDSIFLEGVFQSKVSKELGDFKQEGKIITAIRGLKNYVCVTEKGETIEVIKGISRKAEKKNGKYYSQKYLKTKEALRQGREAGEAYIQEKELTHIYDKRIILPDRINTKPIKLTNSKI
jgi:hypothetical protein